MAPRRKITRVGGNLPLVAQFRVLRLPGLLIARHSFLFLFPFPLFLFISFLLFFLLFYSFIFYSFLPFSFPFLPFSFPFLLSLFPYFLLFLLPYELNWSSHFISFKGAMHVDTWQRNSTVQSNKIQLGS